MLAEFKQLTLEMWTQHLVQLKLLRFYASKNDLKTFYKNSGDGVLFQRLSCMEWLKIVFKKFSLRVLTQSQN